MHDKIQRNNIKTTPVIKMEHKPRTHEFLNQMRCKRGHFYCKSVLNE